MRIAVVAIVLAIAPAVRAADAGAFACPATVPLDGSACAGTGSCEYGADAHGLCSTFASCSSGSWKVTAPSPTCDTSAADCPSSSSALASSAVCPLADHTSVCIYTDGICGCPNQCLGANSQVEWAWTCHAWSGGPPGCPAIRPSLGTPCTDEGQVCLYDGCCGGFPLGPDEMCSGGVWTFHPLNDCACGGGSQACAFSPITLEAGVPDAGTPVGAEPYERLSDGCSCTLVEPAAPGALLFGPFALIVALCRRARRRSVVALPTDHVE